MFAPWPFLTHFLYKFVRLSGRARPGHPHGRAA